MKNLFKHVFLLMALLISVVSFSSCSKDEVESNLVGTWVSNSSFDSAYTYYITLNSSGTSNIQTRGHSPNDVDNYTGQWVYSKDLLILQGGGLNVTWIVVSVTSTTLTVMTTDAMNTYILSKQ